MNSMSEALLSFHSPSKLLRKNIFSKASTFWSLPPLLGWVLVAAELEGDLEVVGGEVVEVLHAAPDRVPGGAVGDPAVLSELVNRGVTSRSPRVRHPSGDRSH